MTITCQHCGTEASDDRVMCPNCRRRMRPVGEQAPSPAQPPAEHRAGQPTQPASAPYGMPAPAAPPSAYPDPDPAAAVAPLPTPVRPHVLFDRAAITGVSRVRVAFRLILAVPHLLLLYVLGGVIEVVTVIAWFAALFTARIPKGLHEFRSGLLRYQTRVLAYLYLLTDVWPVFSFDDRRYPVQLEVGQTRLNRWAVFFRLFLAIPAVALAYLVMIGFALSSFVIWLVVLIVGRVPQPLFDASAAVLRYVARLSAYVELLTPAYPAGLFREVEDWDDREAAATFASYGGPQPPQFTRGSRALTGTFLGLGVLGLAGIVAAAVVAASTGTPGEDLRSAHDRLITALRSDCQGSFTCLTTEAAEDAAAFSGFRAQLLAIDVPGDARDERLVLLNDSTALAGVYTRLARSTSPAQYNSTVAGSNLSLLLAGWDRHYQQLDDRLPL